MAGKENSQHKDPPLALKHKQQTTHPKQAVTGKTFISSWEDNILPDQTLIDDQIV